MPPDAASLVEKLIAALAAEDEARERIRFVRAEQARLIRALRAAGLATSRVAHRVGMAKGSAPTLAERLRYARRLRKRVERETRRRANLVGADGQPVPTATRLVERGLPPADKENAVPKVIKKTIVLEYEDEPERDEEEDEQEKDRDEEADDDSEEEPDEAPRARSRRK